MCLKLCIPHQCTLCLDVFKISTLSSPYSCTCSCFFCDSYIDCTLQHYYISTRRFRIRELACQISNAIHNPFTLHATSCFKGHNTVCNHSFSIRLITIFCSAKSQGISPLALEQRSKSLRCDPRLQVSPFHRLGNGLSHSHQWRSDQKFDVPSVKLLAWSGKGW